MAAMVAPYGDCILDGSQQCWSPPVSQTGYEYAHVGTCVLEDGETIRVATIGGGVPHASLRAAMSVAQDHYANTATRKLVGRYVDSPEAGGIVFLGSAQPGLTYADVYDTLSSAVSGDWRWIPALGGYEMVGAQLVNNPGFVPCPAASVCGRLRSTFCRAVRKWLLPSVAAASRCTGSGCRSNWSRLRGSVTGSPVWRRLLPPWSWRRWWTRRCHRLARRVCSAASIPCRPLNWRSGRRRR